MRIVKIKISVISLSTAIMLFTQLMNVTYADQLFWRVASGCKVDLIEDGFWFGGNTGNHNSQNVEIVYVKLKLCSAANSSDGYKDWAIYFSSEHPELGEVKNTFLHIPQETLSRWVQTLRDAKINDQRVSVKGNTRFPERTIEMPVAVTLD